MSGPLSFAYANPKTLYQGLEWFYQICASVEEQQAGFEPTLAWMRQFASQPHPHGQYSVVGETNDNWRVVFTEEPELCPDGYKEVTLIDRNGAIELSLGARPAVFFDRQLRAYSFLKSPVATDKKP